VLFPAWFGLLFLGVCAAWLATTTYACAILFHGLRDRHLPEVLRGARWLFAPYAVLAAACLLLGGLDALGEFLASFVTWTHVGIVIAVAVAVGLKDLLDGPPDPREGTAERAYNEVRRML